MKRLFSVLLLVSILALFFTGCPINPQNIPPTVVWVSGPPPVVTEKTCTFVWTGYDIDGEITRYEYKQDQADSWTSMGLVNTFTWNNYTNGSHTLHIRAIDNKNVASSPISWTFHYSGNIKPIVNKVSGPDGKIYQSSSTFVWEGFDPDGQIIRYEYRRIVGTTPTTPWISNGKSTSRDWNDYPEGSCTFEVRAVDDSEDYSDIISWTFTYIPSAGYNLTVTTTPDTNLKVKIDGVENPSPFAKSVDKGSSHTIQAVTPQEKDINNLVSGTDKRYTFEKWTDGNTANPRTVTVNSDVTYTAQMGISYKVETATQPSGITTIAGSGWYTANTNKTFTAPTVTGYTFSHWLVNGDNASSSSSLSLKIDNPKKVVAVYNTSSTKHNLTVTTTPDTNLKVKIDGVENPSPFAKSVDKGSSHTIQAVTPQEKDINNLVSGTDKRYTFEKWTDGNTANPRTVTVNSDVTYTAQMGISYKVETATQPSGITTIAGSGWYTANTNKTFTAPTVTGYTFSHWLVNGNNASSSSSLSLKIDNPKKVVAVYNTSSTKHNLTVTTTPDTNLKVKIDGVENPSPFAKSVDKGSSHTIQAVTPQEKDINNLVSGTDKRYTFEKWTDGNTANPRTVTVNSDVTYTAQMGISYKVETATQPSGITTIAGSGWYLNNHELVLKAPSITGATFSHWEVNGSKWSSMSTIALMVNEPKSVVAFYETTDIYLTVKTSPEDELDIRIDATNYISPKTILVLPGSEHEIEVFSPQLRDHSFSVSGVDTCFIFENWTGGNKENPRKITVGTIGLQYTAQMGISYKVETATQPSGITTIAGSGWYTANTNKTFTAPTVTGYTFSHWLVNGNNASSSSSLSLKIDNPKKVVAVYNTSSTKHNLTVTTTPDTNLKVKIDGAENPSPFAKSVDKGSSHTIQAVTPQEKDINNLVSGTDKRYTFEKWTDGNTANPRTVTVNSDVTYTAQMKVEYKVETATQPSGITTIAGSGWYTANTNKTFTAPTVTGYTFSHWLVNGDNASSSSSLSLKIDNPKKVVAVYIEETPQGVILSLSPNSVSANPGTSFDILVKVSNIQNLKSGRIVIDTGKADFVSAEVVGLFSGGQIFGTPIIDGLQTIEIGIAEGTASGTGELLRITLKTNSSTDISLTKQTLLRDNSVPFYKEIAYKLFNNETVVTVK